MPAAEDTVKVIGLLRRKPGASREQFMDHWVKIHAEMGKDIPALRRYVLNFIVSEPTRSDMPSLGIEGQVDGIAEIWFASQAAYADFRASAQAKTWLADGATFIGSAQSFMVKEEVVID